jgi:hypothetical protein
MFYKRFWDGGLHRCDIPRMGAPTDFSRVVATTRLLMSIDFLLLERTPWSALLILLRTSNPEGKVVGCRRSGER